MTGYDPPAYSLTGSYADVTTRVHVGLVRQPRGYCFVCKLRRVLYRITVESYPHAPQATEARCAPCWGIRE